MNSVLLPSRSLSLRRLTFRPFRPQPPCCHLPITAFARYLSRMGRRVYPPGRSGRIGGNAVTRSEVRHWLAGSPTGLAESGSLSYGLVIHLRLLPTPPRGDAVTFGYRFVTQTWWGLAPHRSNVFRDALAQRFIAGEKGNRYQFRPVGTTENDPRISHSVVPTGLTIQYILPIPPSSKLLGYYRTSLRDKMWVMTRRKRRAQHRLRRKGPERDRPPFRNFGVRRFIAAFRGRAETVPHRPPYARKAAINRRTPKADGL